MSGDIAGGGRSSGIDVGGLPPLPDAEVLETQAANLATAGNAVHGGVRTASASWQGLSGVYETPEAGQVLTGFVPVLNRAREVESVTASAAVSLKAYAGRSRALTEKIKVLRADVADLEVVLGRSANWVADISLVDRRQEMYGRVSALAQEILDSDAECATGLNALSGGGDVSAPVIPRSNLNGSTDPISNVLSNVQHFLGSDEKLPDQSWGPATVSVRFGGKISRALGFATAGIGAGQGLYTLLGTTDKVKQTQAWQGIGALAGALVTTSAVYNRRFKDVSRSDLDAILTVTEAGKAMVHADEWGTDPQFAAGAVSFDVGSMFVGGGTVGAGAKAGTLVGLTGRAGALGGRTGKLGAVSAHVSEALANVKTAVWHTTVKADLDSLAHTLDRADHALVAVKSPEALADARTASLDHQAVDAPSTAAPAENNALTPATADHAPADANEGVDRRPAAGDLGVHPQGDGLSGHEPVGTDLEHPAEPLDQLDEAAVPVKNTGALTDAGSTPPDHASVDAPSAAAPAENNAGTPATADQALADARDVVDGRPAAGDPGVHPQGDGLSGHEPVGPTPDGHDSPVTVNDAGQPTEVILGDRTHLVSTRQDQLAAMRSSLDPAGWQKPEAFLEKHLTPAGFADLDGLRDVDGSLPAAVIEEQVARVVERSLGASDAPAIHLPDGASPVAKAVAPLSTKYYYDLTDAQAVIIHDLRHLMGTGDSSTVYQKIMSLEQARGELDGSARFAGSAGGFITKAADTAGLRTIDEIILGLRLDYRVDGSVAYKAGEVEDLVAIRFQTHDSANIQIPDGSSRGRNDGLNGVPLRDVDSTTNSGVNALKDDAVWPNTGHGFTSSRVEHSPVVPELKVDGGVAFRKGSEMWRINQTGDEVLMGVFDGKVWVRI